MNSTSQINQNNIFRILPIILYKKNGFINTYVFLDEGSSVSLIDKEVFNLLDINGIEHTLCLRWTGNTTRQENSSIKSSITVSGVNNNLGLPKQTLNMDDMNFKYLYLNGGYG